MADTTATTHTPFCSNQKQFQIAKLKLPTLAPENIKSQLQLSHGDSGPIHFDLRGSEAKNAPQLLAALISNEIFKTHGSSDAQRVSLRLQKPSFIPNIPLNKFTDLFSEIKQEFSTEVRNFSLIQSEYLQECIKRSRSPGILRSTNKTPETANAAVISQFKNNLGFLVRLLFEIMEGPENIFKGACDMPSLPDIYSTNASKVVYDNMSSLPDRSVKQNRDTVPYKNSPTTISGFNSLFTNKRK